MGRKRKLSQAEQDNLKECLADTGASCSDLTVLKIWNKASELRPGAAHGSANDARHFTAELNENSLRCFKTHELPTLTGCAVRFCLGNLPELLQEAARTSREWSSVLERALASDGGRVTCILYHDEVTCGNILAPRKSGKVCLLYASLTEMHASLGNENAWLCVGLVQHQDLDRVSGGMSRVMALVSRELHCEKHLSGFYLSLPSGQKWCSLRAKTYFVSDGDAQRATWSVKGSSGLKPCLFCCNVLSKSCLQDVQEPFCTITAADPQLFLPFRDQEYCEAADELQRAASKTNRQKLEKVLGITYAEGGLLVDKVARLHMPPSSSCVDVLHVYFSNGVASWEIGKMMKILEEEGISLETLRDSASSSDWRKPASTKNASAYLRNVLLHPKMLDESGFRGQGRDAWRLVFLLHYYVLQLLEDRQQLARESFSLLRAICSELRFFKYRFTPITEARSLDRLVSLQTEHQAAYVKSYGADAIKPKHHHRFHIAESTLKLNWLPNCEVHESKHRHLKGCLLDNQKARINKGWELQQASLGRLFRQTVLDADKFGLNHWGAPPAAAAAAKKASWDLRQRLQDDTLCIVKELRLVRVSVKAGDVLLFDTVGGVVTQCLDGKLAGPWFLAKRLKNKISRDFGSLWTATDEDALLQPSVNHNLLLPAFWQFLGDKVLCLH